MQVSSSKCGTVHSSTWWDTLPKVPQQAYPCYLSETRVKMRFQIKPVQVKDVRGDSNKTYEGISFQCISMLDFSCSSCILKGRLEVLGQWTNIKHSCSFDRFRSVLNGTCLPEKHCKTCVSSFKLARNLNGLKRRVVHALHLWHSTM